MALDEAFSQSPSSDDSALFYLPVTKGWIYRFVLALILICHSSFRNVIVPVLVGCDADSTYCYLLFEFVFAELKAREDQAIHWIGPVRRKLENQKDDLVRFAALIN